MVGHVEGDLTGAVFNGDMVGTLSGPAQRRRARVRAQMDGLLTFGGVTLQGVSAGKLRCSPDDENLFVCAGKMRLCATESRRVIGCVVEPMELAFEQQGGAWELQLNDLETEDGVVTGTATVELDGGTTFDYAVAGKYDANRDVSNLILAGQGTAARSKLKLTSVVLDAGAATSGKLVFRIVNQTGKVELGAP
jgi:hypothetical protein